MIMKSDTFDKEEIIQRYQGGESANKIAISLKTTHHTVLRLLVRNGVKLRDKKNAHKVGFLYEKTNKVFNGEIVYKTKKGRLFIKKEHNYIKGRKGYTCTVEECICSYCGTEYMCSVRHGKKAVKPKKRACSDKCRGRLYSGENNQNWTGNRKVKQSGHILIYSPAHPSAHHNQFAEHRLVMEKHLGRYLKKEEIIHHINGVKDDNRLENLCLCDIHEHNYAHGSVIPLLKGLIDDGIIRFNMETKKYERII